MNNGGICEWRKFIKQSKYLNDMSFMRDAVHGQKEIRKSKRLGVADKNNKIDILIIFIIKAIKINFYD